ncbi:hypothetical protein HNY73_005096 [Argiope bruennichi]|uniref:Uncharacterized protein n=1 Tax=Argiope bruennichi TaxID=94029 RepID=A0A8T0FIG8_ARGBR|nr:hypothetical protein HNY73_005096 [Argiope bruennichi]
MDDVKEFYVTLPSDSSMNYFPSNTQSSYRTKLSAPIILNGEWEVALSEISIPHNWFNITANHNNFYTILYEKEEVVVMDKFEQEIKITYKSESVDAFWFTLNGKIVETIGETKIKFEYDAHAATVAAHIRKGVELYVAKESKLLYMLHLPNEETILSTSRIYQFRISQQSPVEIVVKIVDSTPRSVLEIEIEMSAMFGRMTIHKPRVLFEILNRHLAARNIDELIKFEYDRHKLEVSIILSKYVEMHIEKSSGSSLLRKLNLQENTVIKQTQKLRVNYLAHVNSNDSFKVFIQEYPSFVKSIKHSKDLVIKPGIYKTPSNLLNSFEYIQLSLLENSKTKLHVPDYYEVKFAKALAELLGFDKTSFKSGNYESKYSLDISGGITEIFIYSDLVQSHHVGDSFAPLLRIIPCINEKEDQIVKYYDRPLYFPVRKTFIETIQIELKTSFATDITINGGKTYAILPFRRKPIN